MTAIRRWLVVLGGLALLVASPAVVARWPAGGSAISATQLLTRINASGTVGYSGYAESTGYLSLPVTGQFGSVADLFGGRTDLRVWWRSATDNRVDAVNPGGEADVHTESDGTWTWNYESNTAMWTRALSTPVRLPVNSDVLPTELARRLTSQALPQEVSRLDGARIAGRTAAGLRIRPSQPESSIDHVDIWADPSNGLALRVRVYPRGSTTPAIETSFLDFSPGVPASSTTAFTPPPGAKLQQNDQLDIASAVNRFVPVTPRPSLAGLARNTEIAQVGSVGVYGRGVTELVAVPVPDRIGRSLRSQLEGKPGVTTTANGLSVSLGGINLLVSNRNSDRIDWVLVGTVSAATVTAAATELAATG
jgi:outer membrane lipoprotein-sorting protein